MVLDVLIEFVVQHGIFLVLLTLLTVSFGLGIAYIGVFFKKKEKALLKLKSKWLDRSILESIEILTKISYSMIILAILILITATIYPWFKNSFWDAFSLYFTPIVFIIITIIITIILSQVITRFFRFLRIALKKRPGAILKTETIRFLELTFTYLLYAIGLTIVLVIALGMVGLSDEIWDALDNFFVNNFAPILLLIVGLVILYAISKFITAFINDLKTQETRFHPNTLDLGRNLINYGILISAILIVIFSIFNFTGLGKVSETILIAIIIVVGFVLAMSASGAVGNFFAGLVLMFTSPFELGDTVKLGNGLIGKVQTKALFTTKVLTGDGEEVKLPNSKVMDSQIINYSNIPKAPIMVEIKVGYDTTSEKVHKLLLEAAGQTNDIDLDEQPPKVFTKKFEQTGIRYRLRVHMDRVVDRDQVTSQLLDNIQKTFNIVKVEFSG